MSVCLGETGHRSPGFSVNGAAGPATDPTQAVTSSAKATSADPAGIT
jgi:hypothetical protein